MLKALHRNDTQNTPFVATKDWNLTNVTNEDLILMEHSGSDGAPVALEYIGHTLSASFVDYACAIAKDNQDKDRINPQIGKDNRGLFFPDTEPTNPDGTFKRMVFTQVKNMFYNNYRDPTKIWGMEQIDFDKSQTKKFLAEEFVLLSIPQGTFGEKVLPNTVTLFDFNQDNNYSITDDGFNNLFAGPNIFSHQQEVGEFTNSFVSGSTEFCTAYLSVIPYGPISMSVISSSAFVSWSYVNTIQDGFHVFRSLDGLTYSVFATVATASSRAYTDDTVSAGNTYWYQISVYNTEGDGTTSNTASIEFPSTPPSPPAAPILLEVTSGSAILDWSLTSSVANFRHYAVQRSDTGESGPYFNFTQSSTTHSVDRTVQTGTQYWYRVASVNDVATSSFSNLATINVVPCSGSEFNPVTYTGYVSFATGSTYHNFYGTVLHFTTSIQRNISIWGRSPDFDTFLTLADSTGSILATNDLDGWNPAGEIQSFGQNAALVYDCPSGSYDIEISSNDNNVGRFMVMVSPGPKYEFGWSSSVEPGYCDLITSNGWMLIGENGANAVFFNPATNSGSIYKTNSSIQGTAYSPIQDKCYVWSYINTGAKFTVSVDVFNHSGSLLHHNYYPKIGGQVDPSKPDYVGYLCYDGYNDRILFHRYAWSSSHNWHVFDCATETFIRSGTLNAFNPSHSAAWGSCYSWVNNAYYIAYTDNHFIQRSFPMTKIDASTYAVSNTTVTSSIICQYVSASNLMFVRGYDNGPRTVQLYDPVTDTIIHNQTDLPNVGDDNALFEGGASGDVCTNCYVAAIDPNSDDGGVANKPCVALFDRNTYLPVNYIKMNDEVPSGFSPGGFYTYAVTFNPTTSRIYTTEQCNDNHFGRLYSIRLTRAVGSFSAPYTSSAADTASCLSFKTEFHVTASSRRPATAEFVCSSKLTGSQATNTLLVSDFEETASTLRAHNFNNYFLDSNGTLLSNYTESYTHVYSGKNAVFTYEKYYVMSDGLITQNVTGGVIPINATELLVFDITGSLLTTIPLTYGGRDWGCDNGTVYVYEQDTSGNLWVESFDATTDTQLDLGQIQLGFTFTPSFAFFFATASISSSHTASTFSKQYPYFGRIVVAEDNTGNPLWYFNSIMSGSWTDTGSGDRIYRADGAPYVLSTHIDDYLTLGTGSYKRWSGGATYCPITNHMYWSAMDTGSNPILVETTVDLSIVRVHDLGSFEIQSVIWNKQHRTIDLFSNETGSYRMYVFDPVANTLVCTVNTTTTGSAMGDMGSSIDANINNGDVYIPKRIVGSSSPTTGSVIVYKK